MDAISFGKIPARLSITAFSPRELPSLVRFMASKRITVSSLMSTRFASSAIVGTFIVRALLVLREHRRHVGLPHCENRGDSTGRNPQSAQAANRIGLGRIFPVQGDHDSCQIMDCL